ncbi:bacteriorhodopsin [Natrarchaeobaculum sulfurireducens]|uniref:Bacteriorhodopsin n=1 Tax=Natrarchaeobaculum sulfurireducens TaxID=2044521 RepID=A0A346PN48_9EURY|nr:bacteriorhodopsin [Natrarchaeobaculum sulfurireducens]AXR80943.1 Bacteriorhodopsin [Natrarchaeobaculum sulfurireducens]
MFDISTIYLVSGATLGVATLVFATLTRRIPDTTRRYGVVTVVAVASMALAYMAMAGDLLLVETTGQDQSVARFIGYTVAWGGIVLLTGVVSGCGRANTIALFVAICITLWGSFAGWLVSGILELALTAVTIGGLAAVTYLLLGPIQRAASNESGDRMLLYGKLKHLLLLAWLVLMILSVTSEQNLALLDTFVGQLVASYVDVILFLGFGGFVFNNIGAFEDATDDAPSTTTGNARPDGLETPQ